MANMHNGDANPTPLPTTTQHVTKRHLLLRLLADLPEAVLRTWQEFRRQGPVPALQYLVDHAVRLATGAPPWHYSQVTPVVHVGGQYTRRGWQRLQERGVTAVINLRDEFDDEDAGIAPLSYLYLPTVDNTPPTLEDLCRGVAYIEQVQAKGGQVYVHCMLGVGRSVTLVAAYLVAQGKPPTHAWATLRQVRPFIQPTEGQVTVVNRFSERWPDCAAML
jgi:hypothetical protein